MTFTDHIAAALYLFKMMVFVLCPVLAVSAAAVILAHT